MTLREREYAAGAAFSAGILWILLFGTSFLRMLPGLAVSLGSAVLWKHWWRCPHCGRPLGRSHGRCCPNCGKEIDYDAKWPDEFSGG